MNVVDLRSAEARSRTRCGGKGASLAALIGEAMPVPEGFVVTTDAFSALFETTTLSSALTELHAAENDRQPALAEEVRQRILDLAFPADLEAEVSRMLEAYEGEGRLLWAVRSSAIAEDTGGASFAGQYDTALGISTAEVTTAIQQIWSSAFCERAVRYRLEHGSTETRMAVVIQVLLRPDSGGVCFTTDPVGLEDAVFINANYGLGESVVNGTVTPDTYTVDRHSLEPINQIVGSKESQVVTCVNGVAETAVPPDQRTKPCLSSAQASEIATLALAVEARRGMPVDIEWAYEGTKLYVLQARPITVQPSHESAPPPDWVPAMNTTIDPRYPIYSNGNISEVMPGCVTPLSWDHTGQLIEYAFRSQLESLGAHDSASAEPNILGFFFHRPYVNVSLLIEATKRTPGMTPDTVHEEFIGKPEAHTPAVRAVDFAPHRLPRLFRVLWVVLSHLRSLPDRIEASRRIAERDEAELTLKTVADASDDDLLELVRMSDALATPSVVHVWASTLASVAFSRLRQATARWLGDDGGALASSLVAGIHELPSAKPAIALQELSEKIACSEALASLFRSEADDNAVLDALRRDALGQEFDRFCAEYGHRGVAEAELSLPCWREDPAQVVALIRNNLRPGATGAAETRARQTVTLQRATEVLASLNWWRRRWVGGLVRRARSGFLNREIMKDLVIRRLDRSRRVYGEINQRLGARNLVASPDDMFFLVWEEIRALLLGEQGADGIAAIVNARRLDFRLSQRVDVPKIQRGAARTVDRKDAPHDTVLEGMGVSPGRVTGVARVVTDPRNGAYLEPGEILIAPVTDVAWTPLFAQAAGLVVEVGGLLSHGSIVAREYGVPAVVGVAGATKAIKTGDIITLDGAAGRVLRVDAGKGAS